MKHTISELEGALEIMKSTHVPHFTHGETEPQNQEGTAQSQTMMEPGSERPSESEFSVSWFCFFLFVCFPVES